MSNNNDLIKKSTQNHKKKQTWKKVVAALACVVVFCTTYALVLPALTAEKQTYCGKEEHTHTEDCYKRVLVCGKEEAEAHTHTDACYETRKVLVCGQEEGHVHSDACYTQTLICGLEEDGNHTHSDACYEKTLTCGQEENHVHSDACYEEQKTLTCTLAEGEGHSHSDICYENQLTCGLAEHTHVDACFEKPEEAEEQSEDAIMVANDESGKGYNATDNVVDVTLKKKDGQVWKESDTFTTGDEVKATLSLDNLTKEELKANNNTLHVKLASGMSCKLYSDEVYDVYEGSTKIGTYHYEQDSDGIWYVVVEFLDSFVDDSEYTIGGNIDFVFQWDDDSVPKEGEEKTVTIGQWTGKIKVTKSDDENPSKDGTNYTLSKNAGSLSYSDDGKTIYMDYVISLTVKNDTKAPVTLSDSLADSSGWTYDSGSLSVTGGAVKVNFSENTSGVKTDIQLWPNSGDTVAAGTYTITYRVKTDSSLDVSDPSTIVTDTIHNTVTIPDGSSSLTAEVWKKVTTGKIDKTGKLVEGDGNTYIDYTVYLNSGDIIHNLKTGASFKDTLPDSIELVGDVKVEQYDVKGNLVSTVTAAVDGSNISYTTPTGQYYYVITYRTKVKESTVVPIGGMTVTNTASSTGGVDGSASSEVVVPNHVLSKDFVDQMLAQKDGSWTNTMNWTSTISVKGSLEGYVYEDWAGLKYNEKIGNFSPMTLKEGSVVVKDANGNVVDSSLYTLEDSDHTDSGIKNGLFKITFKAGVTGPVTIAYTTVADMSNFTLGDYLVFINHASVTKDGAVDTDQAQTTTIQYTHDQSKIIKKYYGKEWINGNSGSVTLEPGVKTLPWTIQVNAGWNMTKDVTITDVIPEGVTFLQDTLKISLNSARYLTEADGVYWSYDESTRTLTITLPASAYKSTSAGTISYPVLITYDTELDESFFEGNETSKDITNSAKLTYEDGGADSTFTETVTREVVGKTGSYDAVEKILNYQILINPDESKLNSGNTLTVEDVLDAGSLNDDVKLKSLTLYTALKKTNSKGETEIEPGRLVAELKESDTKALYTYSYDPETNTFKTYVQDQTAYVIIAKYEVTADVTADVALSNSVRIEGKEGWKSEDKTTKIEKDTSANFWKRKDALYLTKHSAEELDTLLNGATFRLQKYENGAWADVGTITTGSTGTQTTGKAVFEIAKNTLYRLTETEAPAGYVVDNTPSYFIAVVGSTEPSLPDSVSGDTGYQKDLVSVYTVEEGKYAQIYIDRYDEKDTTIVEKGQLLVRKTWIDSSKNTITDSDKLAALPEIKVTLTKHEQEGSPTITIVDPAYDASLKTRSVKKNGYLVFKMWDDRYPSMTWTCTDTSVSISSTRNADNSWTVKLGPFTQDATVSSNQLPYADSITAEGGEDSTKVIDTVIGTVTLNSSNNWMYRWDNLDSGSTITYTLTEEVPSGYTVTYSLNNVSLTAGEAFSLGESGDRLVVTNTANPTYALPETGGIGTLPYTAGGLLIMAGALLYGYVLQRRRRQNTSEK